MDKSILEIMDLAKNLIKTKIFFPNARIIRFPIDIRGKKYIKFGKNLTTGRYCRIEAYKFYNLEPNLLIGNNVQINDFVHISCVKNVSIGNNVLIASRVFISDNNHGNYNGENQSNPSEIASKRIITSKDVIIEDNVWIGENVSIMPGIKIEKNAIIGANSIVTKNIPANTISVGNPARVVKKFNDDSGKWEKSEWRHI